MPGAPVETEKLPQEPESEAAPADQAAVDVAPPGEPVAPPESQSDTTEVTEEPAQAPDEPAAVVEEPAQASEEPAAAAEGSMEAAVVAQAASGTTSAEADVSAEPAPPATDDRTVSQYIAQRLHSAGARFCFTVPGESFLPLIDDLEAAGIRVVTARHEGGAAFMAEALAQSTARPQIVMVTRAVGAANAAIGIHTARQDSALLVALVGQVRRDVLGREAFQEADIVAGPGSLASWAAQIDKPGAAVSIMDEARDRLTTGRPGPIVLSIAADVLPEQVGGPHGTDERPPGARGPAADRSAVRHILKLLAASERGLIVAGGGVLQARATKRLVAVSEALAVPVMASWRRPDVFPNDHQNYLGMTGYGSPATVRDRLSDADVILFIGTRMNEISTYEYSIPSPTTRWAHVDLEPRRSSAGLSAPTIAVAADASRFLDSAWSDLRAAALDAEMRGRREARNAADREAYRSARSVGQGNWSGPGVHPGRLIDTLRAVLPDNAILSTDAGNFSGWAARGFSFRRAGTFLGPTSGAMGFGLPAAIAASLHDPDRIAVALCGDGGFAMTMAELETAVRERAHPIAIVFDNHRYGTIAMNQARENRPTASSELGSIDFSSVARAMGALGFSVPDDASFEPALREAIASRQTSVIHVALDPAWISVNDTPVASQA